MKLLDFGLAKFVDVSGSQDTGSAVRPEPKEEPAQQDPLAATLDGGVGVGIGGPGGLRISLLEAQPPGDETVTPRELPKGLLNEAQRPPTDGLSPVHVSYRQLLRETPRPESRPTSQATSVAAAFAANTMTDGLLSGRMEPEDRPLGETSTIKGTPLYMAPEVFLGEPASRRSDVYSMGALLYELCVGQPPHFSTSLHELHRMVTNTDAAPLSSRAPTVDARFGAIVDRCLRRNPGDRYASGEELRDALELISAPARHEDVPEGNPYRGLLPFEAQHRSLFFGRKSEIGTLIERLRTETFVLVAADSGVGKSSVCRAGVLPLVQEGALAPQRKWITASLVPGRQPLHMLCAALSTALGCDEQSLIATVRTDVQGFPRVLRKLLGDQRGLLVFVDQLEELVTIGDPPQSVQVSEALSALSAAAGDSLRLLATVRSDFLARVATLPSLGDDINRAVYLLRPMGPDKLREAVTGPAQLKGVTFESDDLVDELVSSTAHTDGGLPLLQFALAELWDVRVESQITRAALQSIGGVAGALARHADHVVSALQPEPRASARRILMALVTLEGTRARRTEEELAHADQGAKVALEALVRGRLLVARDTPEGPAYEVAHEALIKGWQSLRKWLDEHQEARAVKQRLETAAAEWQRLGRSKETLWSARQLAEIALLEAADISPRERAFIDSSQRRETQKRQLRRVLYVSVPVLLALLYGAVQLAARRNLERQVNALRDQGAQIFSDATRGSQQVDKLRQQAFAAFDAKDRDRGEEHWKQSRDTAVHSDRRFAQAANSLESALALDTRRDDIRDQLAGVLYQRALAAERDRQERLRDELLARLVVYDRDGRWRARWASPATLKLTTTPADAQAEIARYELDSSERWILKDAQVIDRSAQAPLQLAPGSYLLTLAAPGHVPLRYPILLQRDEVLPLQLELPQAAQVPPGFVYVPPGRFLFGFGQEDQMRKIFFGTAPLHEVSSGGYLIAKHEVTFTEWIEYLKAQPAEERKQRLPHAGGTVLNGSIELREQPGGRWRLILQPKDKQFSVLDGEPLQISARDRRVNQDWGRLPVGGISCEDATAYAKWLAATGRLAGARLCTEWEWERAARGADGRMFPHAERLQPDDANYDETYGKQADAFGPDEVGSHPKSRSPFGVDDVVGNHYEWAVPSLSSDPCILRGGSYAQEVITNYTVNRNQLDPSTRLVDSGLRICASLPARR